MEHTIFLVLSCTLVILGAIGAFLPVLPSTPLALLGLFLYSLDPCCEYGWKMVLFFGILTVVTMLVGYYTPIYTTKKFGGSKYGKYGAIAGLIVGLFFAPFGIILGPIIGAFGAEILNNRNNVKGALKSAAGSFVGFLINAGMDFFLCAIMLAVILRYSACTE